MILYSCDKEYDFQSENKVAVNTLESSEITKNTAKIKAVINTNNGSSLTERGICYSLSANPTISNSKSKDSNFYSDLGEFTIALSNLTAGKRLPLLLYLQLQQQLARIAFIVLPRIQHIVLAIFLMMVVQPLQKEDFVTVILLLLPQ